MSENGELWYVKLANGDVHRVTLDELDDAFQAGRISGDVMVLAPAGEKWTKLSELAGLDEAPPPAARAPAQAPMPNSLRPVSLDLSDVDLGAPFQRRSRKGRMLGVVAFVAVAGIAAFVVVRSRGVMDAPVAAAPPPPAMPAPAPATPPPAPVTASNTTDASPLNPRFTPEQREKLMAADKKLDQKIKARQKSRAVAGASHASPKYKSQGFTTGGSKFDPLNSSL
jgi:hypothetical protein